MEDITSTEAPSDEDYNVSIVALRSRTRDLISALLNSRKWLATDNGLSRSWIGLAELCGINVELITSLNSSDDPTAKVLDLWRRNDPENSKVDKLLEILEKIDRYDVIEDITPMLGEDIREYQRTSSSSTLALTTNNNTTSSSNHSHHHHNTPAPLLSRLDSDILTSDDYVRVNQGLDLLIYDAFVLYADDDIDFATELIQTMEKQYDMRFCIKYRDVLSGGLEYDVMVKLISERCTRLIVILSPAFFESSANKFFFRFAQSYGIEQCQRKVIPCVYKQCDYLPPDLRCFFLLDYRRAGKLWNFWDKLRDSIRAPSAEATETYLLNRSRSATDQNQRPTPVIQRNVSLSTRSLTNHVKFNSMSNLDNISETENILAEAAPMVPSSSVSSLGMSSPKESDVATAMSLTRNKSKNWMRRLRVILGANHPGHKATTTEEEHNNTTKEKEDSDSIMRAQKEKKRFFPKMMKRKVALAN